MKWHKKGAHFKGSVIFEIKYSKIMNNKVSYLKIRSFEKIQIEDDTS